MISLKMSYLNPELASQKGIVADDEVVDASLGANYEVLNIHKRYPYLIQTNMRRYVKTYGGYNR